MLLHVLHNSHCGLTSFSRGNENLTKVPKLASGLETVLLDMFLQEREDTIASCLFLPPAGAGALQLACPLCPWRRLCLKVTKLEDHLREDHSAELFYVASGKNSSRWPWPSTRPTLSRVVAREGIWSDPPGFNGSRSQEVRPRTPVSLTDISGSSWMVGALDSSARRVLLQRRSVALATSCTPVLSPTYSFANSC